MNKRYVSAGSKHSYTLIFSYSAFTGIFYITREISYSGFVLLPLVVFLFLNIMSIIQVYVFHIMEKSQ